MVSDQILTQVKTALETQTSWSVYLSYDPTPFAGRNSQFLVLGLEKLTVSDPFDTATARCYGMSARLRVTLLMPEQTGEQALLTAFCQQVLPGMQAVGCTLEKLECGSEAWQRQLRRSCLIGSFTLSGIWKVSEEAAEA